MDDLGGCFGALVGIGIGLYLLYLLVVYIILPGIAIVLGIILLIGTLIGLFHAVLNYYASLKTVMGHYAVWLPGLILALQLVLVAVLFFSFFNIVYAGSGPLGTSSRSGSTVSSGADTTTVSSMVDAKPDSEVSTSLQDAETTELAEVAETYRLFYTSYIDAINATDPSVLAYCSDPLAQEMAARISVQNAQATFTITEMIIDVDSASFYVDDEGYYTAEFLVKNVNDQYDRSSGNYSTVNVAVRRCTARYVEEKDAWYINTAIMVDNELSDNVLVIQ